jgi:hypothetical protein
MPPTITDVGSATSTTVGSQLDSGSTVSGNINDMILVLCAYSNDFNSGAGPHFTSCADGDGVNSYSEQADDVFDPGAAGAGAALGIYTSILTDAITNTFIRVTSPNCTQRAFQVYRIEPGAGETLSIQGVQSGGGSNTATHDIFAYSVEIGDTYFGLASIETDDAVTGDSDTTNGSWSSIITRLADGGADASCMSSASQYKTVTATGNQGWACTTATARDSQRCSIVIRSQGPSRPPSTVTIINQAVQRAAFWRERLMPPRRRPAWAMRQSGLIVPNRLRRAA